MRRNLVAALVAAVAVAGVANADFVRKLKAEKVITKALIVGETDAEVAIGSMTVSNDLTVTDDATVSGNLAVTGTTAFTGAVSPTTLLGPVPETQVIASGGTIAADACGGIKNISSASAVTTDTTNTFTAPAAGNKGCIMQVCNVNASDAITLDDNALANLSGVAGGTPGNTAIGALDCCPVGSTGSVWNQLGPCSQN